MPGYQARDGAFFRALLKTLGLPEKSPYDDAVQAIVHYGFDTAPPNDTAVQKALNAMDRAIRDNVHDVQSYRRQNRIKNAFSLSFSDPIKENIMKVMRQEVSGNIPEADNLDPTPHPTTPDIDATAQQQQISSQAEIIGVINKHYARESQNFNWAEGGARQMTANAAFEEMLEKAQIGADTPEGDVFEAFLTIARTPVVKAVLTAFIRSNYRKFADAYGAGSSEENVELSEALHVQMMDDQLITPATSVDHVRAALVSIAGERDDVLAAESDEPVAVSPKDILARYYKSDIAEFIETPEDKRYRLADTVTSDMIERNHIADDIQTDVILGILEELALEQDASDDGNADEQAMSGIAALTKLLNTVYGKDKVAEMAIGLGKRSGGQRQKYVQSLAQNLDKAGHKGIDPLALLEVIDLVRDDVEKSSFDALDTPEAALKNIASIRQINAVLKRDYLDVASDFVDAADDRRKQQMIAARLTVRIQKRTDLDFDVSDLVVLEALDGIANAKQKNLRGGGGAPPDDQDPGHGNGGSDKGPGGDGQAKQVHKKMNDHMRKEVGAIAGLITADQKKPAGERATRLSATLQKALGGKAPTVKAIIAMAQKQASKPVAPGEPVKLSIELIKKAKWDAFCTVYKVSEDNLDVFRDLALFVVKGGVDGSQAMSTARQILAAQKSNRDVKSKFKNAEHIAQAVEDLLRRRALGEKLTKDVRKEKV